MLMVIAEITEALAAGRLCRKFHGIDIEINSKELLLKLDAPHPIKRLRQHIAANCLAVPEDVPFLVLYREKVKESATGPPSTNVSVVRTRCQRSWRVRSLHVRLIVAW